MSRTAALTLLLAECAHGEQLELWLPLLGFAALSLVLEQWVKR